MTNELNIAPESEVVATQKERHAGKSGDKKSRIRSGISAASQHVMKFLIACRPYEADAVRATVTHVTCNNSDAAMDAADRLAINRFLNYGMNKSTVHSIEEAMQFRVNRSEHLLNSVSPFFEPADIRKATVVIMHLTIDMEAVKRPSTTFPKASNQPSR